MRGYVLEVENEALKDYFGYKSFLDIPIFHKTLGDCILNEMRLCGADEIKSIVFDDFIACIQEDYNYALVFFSNNFISVDDVDFSKRKKYLKGFYLTNSDDKVCGLYCSKELFKCILKECTDMIDFYNKVIVKFFDFPSFVCVKKCITITECNDYFSLIKACFKDEVDLNLPELAQGIYTSSKIPKGDYVIVPPVYIGDDVQIERGTVIGPFTAIYNNVLIAGEANVKESVVFDNAYISDNCFVNKTMCCNNASIRRNSAIFEGCVVGADTIVGECTLVENDTLIPIGSKISSIKSIDMSCNFGLSDEGASFYGFSPIRATLLGSCIGNALDMPAIAVMGDGELNSTALKLSLLGGLISTGCGCYDLGNGFLSSIYHYMKFCELRYGLFIKGNSSGTIITLIDMENKGLSHLVHNELGRLLLNEDIKFAKSYQCKKIRVITSLGRLYISNLVNIVKFPLNFLPVFECENKCIRYVVNTALIKLKINSTGESLIFKINEYGTQLAAEYKGVSFNNETLNRIVSYYSFLDGDKDSPCDFKDAVITCFRLINILLKYNVNLIEAEKSLPSVYVADGEVEYKKSLSSLISHISEYGDVSYKNNIIVANKKDADISITEVDNHRIRITVKASSFDAADEIVGELIDYITCDNNKRYLDNAPQ